MGIGIAVWLFVASVSPSKLADRMVVNSVPSIEDVQMQFTTGHALVIYGDNGKQLTLDLTTGEVSGDLPQSEAAQQFWKALMAIDRELVCDETEVVK